MYCTLFMESKTKLISLEARTFPGTCDKDASGQEKKKGTLRAMRDEWETLLSILKKGSRTGGESENLAWEWDAGSKIFLSAKRSRSNNCVKTSERDALAAWIRAALLAEAIPSTSESPLHILTWNVGTWFGVIQTFPKQWLKRFADLKHGGKYDVIFLQEVKHNGAGKSVANELSDNSDNSIWSSDFDESSWSSIYSSQVTSRNNNAIVTLYKKSVFNKVKSHDLTVALKHNNPISARPYHPFGQKLELELKKSSGKSAVFFNLHLKAQDIIDHKKELEEIIDSADMDTQALDKTIAKICAKMKKASNVRDRQLSVLRAQCEELSGKMAIVGGDFNMDPELIGASKPFPSKMKEFCCNHSQPLTYLYEWDAQSHVYDYIGVWNGAEPDNRALHVSRFGRKGSSRHFPVEANVAV
jgi:endonuclease/exonuclease/phosphatase family metal-dependent hydrolase